MTEKHKIGSKSLWGKTSGSPKAVLFFFFSFVFFQSGQKALAKHRYYKHRLVKLFADTVAQRWPGLPSSLVHRLEERNVSLSASNQTPPTHMPLMGTTWDSIQQKDLGIIITSDLKPTTPLFVQRKRITTVYTVLKIHVVTSVTSVILWRKLLT